jgi:hypothetical protein
MIVEFGSWLWTVRKHDIDIAIVIDVHIDIDTGIPRLVTFLTNVLAYLVCETLFIV